MKKLNKFAFMSAIALGAVGFTACSSDDDITSGQNPTFDGETVKTQFTINVPAGRSTRLAQDVVQGQATPVFRGMDNINMFAFDETSGSGVADIQPTTNPAEVYNDMGSILNNELMETSNAKVYYDIAIPTGVNRFLFYGEATPAAGATNETNGVLKATYPNATTGTVGDIKFELQQIATGANTTTEGTLLTALNNVAGVENWSTTSNTALKNLYLSYLNLKAGSANSIRKALSMLKEGVTAVTEENVAALKSAIILAIEAEIGTDGNGGNLASLIYPRDLGLPDGAVQIEWDTNTSKFKYSQNSGNVWGASQAAVTDYVYPAALYYWANSTIKVSNETESDKYTGTWDNILNTLYTDGSTVEETTRSVAMEKQINYGVARFDLSAYLNGSTLKDNVSEDVDVTTGEGGMQLVGILVGGQKNVTYDFSTPVTGAEEKSIYDRAITQVNLSESENTNVIAQTLVLETAAAAQAGEGKVRFALELQNNTGKDFVGYDGTVPAGGRFYLIGELEPDLTLSSAEEQDEKGTYKNGMDGKVFKQDFTTTAKVKISSLAHAYNTIPDLRSPKLELGLSVNLDWQSGLVDEVEID